MEPTEIQARATIAAALILTRAVEIPTIPTSGDWEGYCRSSAARSHRLRLPDDYESTASLIYRAEPTSHPHVIGVRSGARVVESLPCAQSVVCARQNLTMRMSMRRFTRLTNAFSKKMENHAAAIALYFMYYHFGRVHQTLRVTPAMEAGITDHVWSADEIVGLLG